MSVVYRKGKYGIKATVSVLLGKPIYTVHVALGPWPLKNWSWTPEYSSADKEACISYIDKAVAIQEEIDRDAWK